MLDKPSRKMYNFCMENVYEIPLTNRAARNVAPALKRMGYGQITIEQCDGKTPAEIANALEPFDNTLAIPLMNTIAIIAGYKPKKAK